VVGMAATTDNGGYWLAAAADGGFSASETPVLRHHGVAIF
jgi:hypothetical protein